MQALESHLQEVIGQQTSSDEAMEVEQVDEVVVEISDLRVWLAKAKGEKEEMNGKLEMVLEEQRMMKQWIEALEKLIPVRETQLMAHVLYVALDSPLYRGLHMCLGITFSMLCLAQASSV